jgi:hypothetical protein
MSSKCPARWRREGEGVASPKLQDSLEKSKGFRAYL